MMDKSNSKDKRTLTLLELSRKKKLLTPPPPLAESTDSDSDQPPVALVRKQSHEPTGRKASQQAELKSLTSRGSSRSSPRLSSRPRIKSFSASSGSCSAKSNGKLLRDLSAASATVSSDKPISSDRSESTPIVGNNDLPVTISRPRNHYIKAIRRGIPEIVTTDTGGRSRRIIRAKLSITPYCVCHRTSKTKSNWVAWFFSFLALVLCVVCPVVSFTLDISFFAICKNNYHKINAILEKTEKMFGGPTVTTVKTQLILDEKYKVLGVYRGKNNSQSFGRKTESELREMKTKNVEEVDGSRDNLNQSEVTKQRAERENVNVSNLLSKNTFEKAENFPMTHFSIRPATANQSLMTRCQNIPNSNTCASKSELINYMTTLDARMQLEGYKHVITDVFDPIFIIGSFTSFLLCILARLVILLTSHDHFLSAYVMNMVTMPLSLATGALAFNSASYYAGPFGFECWKCAWADNCSGEISFTLLNQEISSVLLAVVSSKFVDGFAGGCVLFVVLFRLIWSDNSHVTCFWNLFRGFVSIMSLTLCVALSTSMMVMPSLAVFQFKLLEKLPYFESRESLCSSSMSLLILGITAWAVSLFVLVVYLSYRTFVYCRIREHPNKEVFLL